MWPSVGDANDAYELRAFDTTCAIPRFNNSGTQNTVLLLQNPADYTISGNAFFWNTSGTQVGAPAPFSLGPRQTLVLNTAGVVPGASGAVTITQDGRFGDLQGKSVALEPSTGFSFDTPMVYRPH